MKYCNFCAKLTVDQIINNDVKFHPNLKSLKESAESGCVFCGVCWAGIQANRHISPKHMTELLNGERPSTAAYSMDERDKPWYPSIWLHGNLFPVGPRTRGGHIKDGDGVWITCGRCRSSNDDFAEFALSETNPPGGSPMSVKLSVYALAGSAAARIYAERCIAADPDSGLLVSFILSRLQECRANHKRCAGPISLQMPTRVVDIGGNRPPRLIITGDMHEPYMALSYCWGPSKDTLKLTHDNFEALLVELPETLIAKTHQEAIQLARTLGFRYLWIDALCIIQGDTNDWAFESRRMEQVYGNASLTLVAARSADARVGFITPKTEPEQQHCPLPLSSSTSEVLYFSPYRHQTIGPTSTRGWCYQEEVLSKRMVIFAQHQIAYYCRTWSSWEDGSCITWNSPIAGTGVFPSDATDLKVRREKTLVLWYHKIQAYTLRNLSNPHDVFAAIASIAKLAQEVLDSRYLAGLWESDIARGLLWKPKHHIVNGFWPVIRPRSRTYAPSPVTRAPSWSWASIEGPVFHQHAIKKGSSRLNVSIKLRPGAENNRWTADENCDVKELHIPHRELSLIGKISKAFVLDTPARDYLCDKESSWWKKYGIQKAIKIGVLLADAEFMNGDKYMLNDDNRDLDEKVVAIGMFDVAEEATKAVWCLRVIEREGLMLIKQGDQWSRVGTFLFERVSWFDGKDDRHIRLI